jgi:hypothetical protein
MRYLGLSHALVDTYPVDTMNTVPPVVAPMYFGRFDFSKMTAAERERAFKH